jgi:hypothetical protein
VPTEESNKYRLAWDPDLTETWNLSKDAVKKRFLEKLTAPLTERGFRLIYVIEDSRDYQPYAPSFTFLRKIPGVEQVIKGNISGDG